MGPLSGIRVVDVTEGAQGPFAASLLGDMGAEVIKVERPDGELMRSHGPFKGGVALPVLTISRSRAACLTLDLKNPTDKENLLQLIDSADVFIENWRPGAADRLGLGEETLRQRNPRLVYVSGSGFGRRGPNALLGSMDTVAQSMSGVASTCGAENGESERVRFVILDFGSALVTAEAALAGLAARELAGVAQRVDTSQLEAGLALMADHVVHYSTTGEIARPLGSASPYLAPAGAFQGSDGSWVAVEIQDEAQWESLCTAIGQPEFALDPRFTTNGLRLEHRPELETVLTEQIRQRPSAEWVERFTNSSIPASWVVPHIAEVVHASTRSGHGEILTLEHPVCGPVFLPQVPWEFSHTPARVAGLCPAVGDQNERMVDLMNRWTASAKRAETSD